MKLLEFFIDVAVRSADAIRGMRQIDNAAGTTRSRLNAVGMAAINVAGRLDTVGQRAQVAGSRMTLGLTVPLIYGLRKAGQAAREADSAMAVVEQRLATMGKTAGFTLQQLQEMAGGLMKQSLTDDDEILRDLTSNLLTYGQVTGKTFADAQKAILDLAAAKKQDVGSTTDAVGKALSSARGVAALMRSGTLLPADVERIKLLWEQGKILEAQRQTIAAINKQYGGTAAALRKANPEQAAALDAANAAERLGAAYNRLVSRLLPSITKLLDWFNSLSDKQLDLAIKFGLVLAVAGPLLTVFGTLARVLALVIGPMGRVLMFFTRFSSAGRLGIAVGFKLKRVLMPLINVFRMLGGAGQLFTMILRGLAFTPIGRLISLLVLAGGLIYQNWDTIGPMFADVGKSFVALWATVQPLLAELWTLLVALWQGPAGEAIRGLARLVGSLLTGAFKIASYVVLAAIKVILAAVIWMVKAISATIKFFVALFTGDWEGAWNAVKEFWAATWTAVVSILESIVPGISKQFAAVYDAAKLYLQDKMGAIFDWFGTKWNQLTSGNIGDFTGLWDSGSGNAPSAPGGRPGAPTVRAAPATRGVPASGARPSAPMNQTNNFYGQDPAAAGRAVDRRTRSFARGRAGR